LISHAHAAVVYSQEHGENISGSELHSILSEIDTTNNGRVELEEYLQVPPETAIF
jgi:Ca2+-binding EF-hand superfamily protein